MSRNPLGDRGKTRVLIADDHPIVRRGFKALLEGVSRFDVVGSFSRGDDALSAILQQRPDIAILDFNMPGMRGVEVARLINGEAPTRVVLIGENLASHDFFEAAKLNVAGVMGKEDALDKIVECIDAVAAGGFYMTHAHVDVGQKPLMPIPGARLTARELEVVQLAAVGLTNKHIARRLNVCEGTVKIHMHNIFRKAGLNNRTELASLMNHRSTSTSGQPDLRLVGRR